MGQLTDQDMIYICATDAMLKITLTLISHTLMGKIANTCMEIIQVMKPFVDPKMDIMRKSQNTKSMKLFGFEKHDVR